MNLNFRRFFLRFAGASLCLLFTGCIYTTHFSNTGRPLPSGESRFQMGSGAAAMYESACQDVWRHTNLGDERYREQYSYSFSDKNGAHCALHTVEYGPLDTGKAVHTGVLSETREITPDPMRRLGLPKASIGWRLGILDPFWKVEGLDMGIHFEAPTNPVSLAYDVRMGLPFPWLENTAHSLSLGFIMGTLVDNSWFGEYAVSRLVRSHPLFFCWRTQWSATQYQDLGNSYIGFSELKFPHNRRWIHQAAAGVEFRLPGWPVLPDFITPVFSAVFPEIQVPFFGNGLQEAPAAWEFNVTMGWHFK